MSAVYAMAKILYSLGIPCNGLKIYNKTHGLLQRILRNRDIAVLMLMSMIFKVSFAISPIGFIISWSGIIDRLL